MTDSAGSGGASRSLAITTRVPTERCTWSSWGRRARRRCGDGTEAQPWPRRPCQEVDLPRCMAIPRATPPRGRRRGACSGGTCDLPGVQVAEDVAEAASCAPSDAAPQRAGHRRDPGIPVLMRASDDALNRRAAISRVCCRGGRPQRWRCRGPSGTGPNAKGGTPGSSHRSRSVPEGAVRTCNRAAGGCGSGAGGDPAPRARSAGCARASGRTCAPPLQRVGAPVLQPKAQAQECASRGESVVRMSSSFSFSRL